MKKLHQPPVETIGLEALFKRIERELARVYKHLDILELSLDSYRLSAPAGSPVKRRRARERAPVLKEVQSFSMTRRANGHADVSVNGVAISLTPVLADLLAFLAQGTAPASDAWVEFKSMEAIGAHLAERHKRTFKEHAIRQAIWRLRRVFFAHQLDVGLIDTSAAGARFAWRGSAGSVMGIQDT